MKSKDFSTGGAEWKVVCHRELNNILMVFINRVVVSLFYIFCIQSCTNNDTFDVEGYVKKIDSLDVSKVVYLIETDSNYSFMDTIIIRKLKYDSNQALVFENIIQLKNENETLNYYDSLVGMIYSVIRSEKKVFMEYKTIIKDGLITSATYSTFEEDGSSMINNLKYYYTYNKGKLNKLIIDSGDEFLTFEYYNSLEEPTLNVILSNNDTVEKTNFYYDDNYLLQKKEYNHFDRGEHIIYEYKDGKEIFKESYLQDKMLIKVYRYSKDTNGNLLRYTASQ